MLAFLLRDINPDDWRKFKAVCALRGTTLREALLLLIGRVVAGDIDLTERPKPQTQKDKP